MIRLYSGCFPEWEKANFILASLHSQAARTYSDTISCVISREGHWRRILTAGGLKLFTRFHPETQHCHSEPFDELRAGSAKDLGILRRPAICATPQNDNRKGLFGMGTA